MAKPTVTGIKLERALEMYPRRVGMPDVLEGIKNKERKQYVEGSFHRNDSIEEVALFSSENFEGAVYVLHHDYEDLGYDSEGGSLHYQFGAVYFDKRTASELILPESVDYLHYPKMGNYADCGRHSIYLQQLSEDKLKIELSNKGRSRDSRPKFKAICNIDLANKVIVMGEN